MKLTVTKCFRPIDMHSGCYGYVFILHLQFYTVTSPLTKQNLFPSNTELIRPENLGSVSGDCLREAQQLADQTMFNILHLYPLPQRYHDLSTCSTSLIHQNAEQRRCTLFITSLSCTMQCLKKESCQMLCAGAVPSAKR